MEITIARPQEPFNKQISYRIVQGKTELGRIGNGEKIPISVDPEKGSLKIKTAWCGSQAIHLDTLASTKLEVKGNTFFHRQSPFLGALLCILGVGIATTHHNAIKGLAIGLISLVIFYAIAILSVWKDKWIFLKEIK